MRKSAGPIASGDHASLPGGSPLLCGMERENSSRAAADFMPEIDDNEPSSDCLFLEIAVTDDGASAFAELRVSTEQYSFAPIEAKLVTELENLNVWLYPGIHPLRGLQYYTCGRLEWLLEHTEEAFKLFTKAVDVLRITHGTSTLFMKELLSRMEEARAEASYRVSARS
ncbi:hypothetical protein Taro_003800 [Colocasia esculenta]|uniref:Uncharacterized protein n=1 Tax=Colocasia esculenta TaxID=4460 RepID=A0A843TN64_COLES|nr:hypothetical protein [Colocasia esculenta]